MVRFPTWPWTRAIGGAGVASRLIEHALDYLRSCGMRVAKIETLVQNAQGQTLYPRFGFQEVARQIHYVRRLDDD